MQSTERDQAAETAIKRTIYEFVVCLGSQLDGHEIRNIAWPPECLVICIRRGEKEIFPTGDTKLSAGDYLYLSVADQAVPSIQLLVTESISVLQ